MPAAMEVCGGPLQPVCDTVGGLAGSLGGTASDLVLKALGTGFVTAADQVSQAALDVLDATTSVDLNASWFRANLAVIALVALPVVVGLFVLQVIAAVLRREPGGLVRAVVGVGKAMLGAGIAVAVTASALVACDQICVVIANASGTSVTGAARRLLDLTWLAGPGASPVLQMLLSLGLIVGFLLLWAVMLFRKAALLLVVVFAPVAFAGAVFDHTRVWTRRWIEAVAALVLCKVVIVVVFVVGASAFGGVGPTTNPTNTASGTAPAGTASGSLSDILAGGLLLTIAVFAPWLTWRFLHWSGMEAAGVLHTAMATSPVPAAARSAALQVRSTTTRAASAALITAGSGGAGAPAAVGVAAGGAGRTPTAARPPKPSTPGNGSGWTGDGYPRRWR